MGSKVKIVPGDELIVPTSKYNAYHSSASTGGEQDMSGERNKEANQSQGQGKVYVVQDGDVLLFRFNV